MVFTLCGLLELDGKILNSCILFLPILINDTSIITAWIEFLNIISY